MKMHTMRDGRKIPIRGMDDSHLNNTIAMIERKAREGITLRAGGGATAEDMWYDEEHLEGKEALDYMGYMDYVLERRRRETGSAV